MAVSQAGTLSYFFNTMPAYHQGLGDAGFTLTAQGPLTLLDQSQWITRPPSVPNGVTMLLCTPLVPGSWALTLFLGGWRLHTHL